MKAHLKIKGVDELKKALADALSLEIQREAIKYHSADLQIRAQRKAPVDTGFMKRHISAPKITDNGLTATVTSQAEYSGYVEKGTRFMDAQPFMEPALNEVMPAFLEDMKKIGRR